MKAPSRADYVKAYFTLFDQFEQTQTEVVHLGHPFVYADRILVVFFTMMLIRRITAFKAQRRWLETHPDETKQWGTSIRMGIQIYSSRASGSNCWRIRVVCKGESSASSCREVGSIHHLLIITRGTGIWAGRSQRAI
jgi:hypothetical protein